MRCFPTDGWYMIHEIDLMPMVSDHAGIALLCDRLERVADALPARPTPDQTQQLCSDLEHRLPAHEKVEITLQRRLFPRRQPDPMRAAALDRMRKNMASHVVEAQDIVLALQTDDSLISAETLGYMLRSFFEGCRKAMAFEELAVLSFARERLTQDARDLLEESIPRRCSW